MWGAEVAVSCIDVGDSIGSIYVVRDFNGEVSMYYRNLGSIIAVISAVFFLSSCSVTTAPIEASSEVSSEASSETTGQTSDVSSDLTSSKDDDNDGAVDEFVSSNFSQLRSDMSVGRGEHLAALASLLAIDDASKDQFYAMTKDNFSDLFISSKTTPQELIVNLKQEVSQAKI